MGPPNGNQVPVRQAVTDAINASPRSMLDDYSDRHVNKRCVLHDLTIENDDGPTDVHCLTADTEDVRASTYARVRKGIAERCKARFCAKRFTQVEGVDFTENSAPVAKMNSIHVLLSMATTNMIIKLENTCNYDMSHNCVRPI